ncbi:uncharacterized protein LOC125547422 [Triticum urartu]|uniref:uncharacterized protein LOC125547422 n=1 Tax=Triticum urartu TaxID=4572 RepID=UPI002044221C|nr:uncharacterized protein LOC125547422 [Triticum urartu]
MAAEERTFLLETPDGMSFVVSEREASQSGEIHCDTICYDGQPIDVNVEGNTLAKALHYCKKHAYSDDHDLRAWDAKFVSDLDLETLYDLILASHKLEIQGLLALTCQTLANKIKGKSPHETCHVLNIRGVFTPELHQEHSSESCASHTVLAAMKINANWWHLERKLVDKALRALDIVRCQDFTGYEPKIDGLVRHRFSDFNLAFFDLDKESEYFDDCSFHYVRESDVGFPVDIFGTVVARDTEDYRCVYLFRRERDDPQHISSPVYNPVEATIEINVLKGPCNISRVAASTPGNFRDHIILYEAAGGSPTVIGDGGSVPLSRRVVAVTREQKLALFLVGGDALEYLALTLGHSDEVVNRRMGCAQVEVKVAWTAVPARKKPNMFKAVANQLLLM